MPNANCHLLIAICSIMNMWTGLGGPRFWNRLAAAADFHIESEWQFLWRIARIVVTGLIFQLAMDGISPR